MMGCMFAVKCCLRGTKNVRTWRHRLDSPDVENGKPHGEATDGSGWLRKTFGG